MSCQLLYFRKKQKQFLKNMSNTLRLIKYNKRCDIISSLQQPCKVGKVVPTKFPNILHLRGQGIS